MLAFWIELKRRAKANWAVIAGVAISALVAAYALVRRKNEALAHDVIDDVMATAKEKVAAANAQAAIEIHVAATKEAGVHEELKAIVRDPDGDSRRQRMIELAARVEGRKS
jgi:hypothetical protein